MARPKRALGELGKVTYTVEPSALVIARGRVFDGNGHERRPSGSGATEAEALAALQEAADAAVGRVLARRTKFMTVAELAAAWLKTAYHDDDPRVLRQRREQTVDGYASIVRAHVIPRAGAIPIADITADRADGLADYILITLGTSERTAEPIAIRFQDVRFEAVEQPDGSLTMEALVRVGGTMVRTKSRGLFRQDSPKAERQKRWVLRKAVAAAVSDTAGVEVARDLLGHSSTDITEGHYAKRPDLIVEIAADALDEAFAGIDV